MTLSTATPERLPSIETLRLLTKSLAMLDAIVCPEWEYRYYSFNSQWGSGEEMASMRNGSGDDWFLLFDPVGAALKGCAHDYPLASDKSFPAIIQKRVPAEFSSFLHEAAFSMEFATFCLWRRHGDAAWSVVLPADGRVSPAEDGSAGLISILDGRAESYRCWAEDYYERRIPIAAVEAVYRHRALDPELVAALNPDLTLSNLAADATEIGYPHSITA